jgi:hypothetical protein
LLSFHVAVRPQASFFVGVYESARHLWCRTILLCPFALGANCGANLASLISKETLAGGPALVGPQKITFAQMRDSGVRGS